MNTNVSALPELTSQERIDRLGYKLNQVKKAESEVRETRLLIEDQIIELVGAKPEGAFTVKGDQYHLTTTGKLTRTLIEDQIPALQSTLPQPIFDRLIRYKPSLDLKELRYLEANEPQIYTLAAKAFTTKPAKIAVSVKEVA